MKRNALIGLLMGAALLTNVTSASAQRWGRERTPQSGVCFYEDINFNGRYFCTPAGADATQVPSGINDRISSVRVFGDAEVAVYRDPSFRGQEKVINSNVADLRRMGFNDRISSYRVDQTRGFNRGRDRDDRDIRGRDDDRFGNGNDRRRDDDRFGNGNDRRRVDANSRIRFDDAQDMVRRGFRSILGRDVDPSGLRSWTEQVMRNSWTQRELEDQLRNTDEYRQTQGGRRRR